MTITLQTVQYAGGGFLHVTLTESEGSSVVTYQEFDANGNPITEPEEI